MKFKQENEKFKPVTITLETEGEVMLLSAALAKVSGNSVDDGLIYKLYGELTDVADYSEIYVSRLEAGAVRLYEL